MGGNMRLPESVREIAAVIGSDLALYLIGQLPTCYHGSAGKKAARVVMYVPTLARLSLDHRLVRILGWPDAAKLCRAFGGEILYPANCAHIYREFRDASVVRMAAAGMRTQAIADVVGVSERHVRNLLAAEIPPEDSRQAANDNGSLQTRAMA